jgi:hypothetical protein
MHPEDIASFAAAGVFVLVVLLTLALVLMIGPVK